MERLYFYQRKLQDVLSERIGRNPRYSLRAFAQLLKLDPGTFSQMLSGKRFPSPKLAQNIFETLSFSPEEQADFLRSLAEAKSNAGLRRISPSLRKLLEHSEATTAGKELSLDLFKVIGDWYHFSLLELPFTQQFKSTPAWIAKALGISTAEAQSATERLIDLELLAVKNGKLQRLQNQLISGDRHLTSAAHKKRQKQVLEKSIESLQNDLLEERNHTAMSFAINTKKLPEAKKKIEKFMEEMTEFLETGERDRVYEMTVNLFPTQRKQKQKKEVTK